MDRRRGVVGARPRPGVDPTGGRRRAGESFAFKFSLDANDMIADGSSNPVAAGLATASGVYTRLAALEMLQYPIASSSGASLVGSVSASISSGGLTASLAAGLSPPEHVRPPLRRARRCCSSGDRNASCPSASPSCRSTETLYDAVVEPDPCRSLDHAAGPDARGDQRHEAGISSRSPRWPTPTRRACARSQAVANLGDAAASIIGMLPNPF